MKRNTLLSALAVGAAAMLSAGTRGRARVVIGPHTLRVVRCDGFVAVMGIIGMASSLFQAGMEVSCWPSL